MQLIIIVHTPNQTYGSIPLHVDIGFEEEMLKKAKQNLEELVGNHGRLTMQTSDTSYIIIPDAVLSQSIIQIELVETMPM